MNDIIAPLMVRCPACFVERGQRCTAPTDTSRREVMWFHLAREAEALRIAAVAAELTMQQDAQAEWDY